MHTSEKEVEQAKHEMMKMNDMLKDIKANNQVSLTCLLRFSDIKQDKFDDIMDRIIAAFGIDYKDVNARLDFDMYVRIKCFTTHFTISKEELTKLWMRIINPSQNHALNKEDLLDLFEKFARGRT